MSESIAFHANGRSDRRSSHSLVEAHLGVAHSLARRMGHRYSEQQDLQQVAYVGLVKAADRFDPSFGVKFTTFAWKTIEGELRRYFRDNSSFVHVNRSLQERAQQVGNALDVLAHRFGRAPTYPEVAAEVGCTVEEVLEGVEVLRSSKMLSIASDENDIDGAVVPVDSEDTFEVVDDRQLIAQLGRWLSTRERRILYLRFYEELSQSEIAARLGCSQMHVSRLLARSLAIMRERAAVEA